MSVGVLEGPTLSDVGAEAFEETLVGTEESLATDDGVTGVGVDTIWPRSEVNVDATCPTSEVNDEATCPTSEVT